VLAAVLVAGAWPGAIGLCASAQASAAAPPTRVSVSIGRSGIVFASTDVPAGVIAFTVVNRTLAVRDFGIGTRRTRAIAAGRSRTLTVTLTRGGAHMFTSFAAGRSSRLSGVLDVFEPCATPARSRVEVQMAQGMGGISVSQASVPCGTVTFVVADSGTLTDSLQVFSQRPAPWVAGQTPELQPGQTATLTLRFPGKGLVHFQSGDYPPGEPENGFREVGRLSLV
jgi:hypothetical protein